MPGKVKLIDTPFANVFLFSLFWALQIVVSKLAFNAGAHPLTYTIQLSIVSLFLLSAYVLPQKYQELVSTPRHILVGILLANAIHFGLGGTFNFVGTSLASAVNVGFLGKFAMVSTLIFAWFLLKEKLTKSKLIASLLLIIGVFLVTTKGQMIIPHTGDILIILACVFWSLGNVMLRRVLKNNPVSGELVSFLRPVIGLPVLFFFYFISPLFPKAVQPVFAVNLFDLRYLNYVVGSALFSSLLAIFLYRTLKVASASYMTMMSMMTPVMVSLMAIIILGEEMMMIQVVGAILIVLSGVATHYLKIEEQ